MPNSGKNSRKREGAGYLVSKHSSMNSRSRSDRKLARGRLRRLRGDLQAAALQRDGVPMSSGVNMLSVAMEWLVRPRWLPNSQSSFISPGISRQLWDLGRFERTPAGPGATIALSTKGRVGTTAILAIRDGRAVARKSIALLAEALDWMESQFKALGKGAESRGLAIHLMSATQGVSVLAYTFHDRGLIEIEAEGLKKWIRAL